MAKTLSNTQRHGQRDADPTANPPVLNTPSNPTTAPDHPDSVLDLGCLETACLFRYTEVLRALLDGARDAHQVAATTGAEFFAVLDALNDLEHFAWGAWTGNTFTLDRARLAWAVHDLADTFDL